jgi:hypothetical protein
MSRAARAAFVFWGGPAFAPVWRLRAEVGAPLVREDLSGDLPGAAPVVGAKVEAAREVPVADGTTTTIRLRASGSLYLSSPLERRRGRGQDCSSTHPEACAAAVRPPRAGVVVVAVRAGGSEPPVSLLLLRRPSPIEWGCSYLRRRNRSSVCNGTLSAGVFVHCGCRGLNMYVVEPCFFLIFEH